MDAKQTLTRLVDWKSSWSICPSHAACAVAVSLAASWLYEHEEADLSATKWADVPHWVDAAMQDEEEAIARLAELEGQQFQQKLPLALVAADADQIQAYVFESAKIPEVRGASALVEWLNLKGLKQKVEDFGLPEEIIVYRGGGGAMLLVPAVIAEDIKQAVEEQFVENTHVATITTVSHPVSLLDLLKQKQFQRVQTALMHALQIRKLQKESSVHFEWLPFALRCQACEVRPAYDTHSASADRPFLCEACKAKRDKGRAQRLPLGFHAYLRTQFQNGVSPLYLEGVQVEKPTPERIIEEVDRAEDLNEFSHNGYVGVIAADGDGIGRILTQLNSLSEYGHFSEKLYSLSNQCVYEPLARLLRVYERKRPKVGQGKWFHPFELVALGGDDLFLILPGNKALMVAQSVTDYWRDHCVQVIPENRRCGIDNIAPPTLSFGLLICPHTFPVYFMHHLAEQLLHSAKASRSKANGSGGFIDFLILKSSGTPRTEAEQIQNTLYRYQERGQSGDTLWLTERPYPLAAFDNLVQIAGTLKRAGMTRTQRNSLAHSLRLGRFRSTMDVLLYWSRRSENDEKGRQTRACLEEWVKSLQNERGERPVFPWCRDDQRRRDTWTTQLLDVLELMEWVEVNNQ